MVVGAGICLAVQQPLNTNLRVVLGSPWWAGLVSFLVGALVMLAAGLASPVDKAIDTTAVTQIPWRYWFGGVLGAIFIGVSILTTPRLGATTVFALIVVGQMLGSLTLDHFGLLGLAQHELSPTRMVGVVLLVTGVILIQRQG